MSARIYRLLAEDLDISEERAQKLLRAMMREVQKRAQRGGGIRIPNLGAFVVEDGEMQFTPSDSLASAVNHRYEGLSEEDLSTAGKDPEEEEDVGKGPTTITSGLESALSSGTGSTDTGGASSTSDADTDEFQMSDAESGSRSEAGADTEEFQGPSDPRSPAEGESPSRPAASDDSPEEPDDSTGSSSPDTGSLYDIVKQTPGAGPVDTEPSASSTGDGDTSEEETAAADEESTDSSKGSIWDTDEPWDFSQASMSEEEEEDQEEPSSERIPSSSGESAPSDRDPPDRDPQPEPTSAASSSDDTETVDAASDTDQTTADPASQQTSHQTSRRASQSDGRGGSTLARILVSLIVGILIAGAAWFMAGQQGLVPPPGKVLASLQSPTSTSPTSTSPPASETAPSAQEDAAPSTDDTGSPSAETSPTEASSSPASAGEDSEGDRAASESPAAAGFTPDGGNWTISVASRADRSVAEDLADSYRNRFSATELPVDIVTGTVDGQERHRVGVGQFSTRDEARAAIAEYDDSLPPGAWPVQISP